MSEGVKEVLTLEPRHQTGKDGIGKGSQRRRGDNPKAYAANYDAVFGKKDTDGSASSTDSGQPL